MDGWLYAPVYNSYIGMRIRRFFPNYGRSDGIIDSYLPPHLNDGVPYWHLLHDDDDDEDVELEDMLQYRKNFLEDIHKSRKNNDDSVFVDDSDDYEAIIPDLISLNTNQFDYTKESRSIHVEKVSEEEQNLAKIILLHHPGIIFQLKSLNTVNGKIIRPLVCTSINVIENLFNGFIRVFHPIFHKIIEVSVDDCLIFVPDDLTINIEEKSIGLVLVHFNHLQS